MGETIALAFAIFAVGGFIGLAGIGGVLLVPLLVHFTSVEPHRAVAAALLAYVPVGLLGATLHLYRRPDLRTAAAKLCIGAAPGAAIGSCLLWIVPGRWILGCLGVACIAAVPLGVVRRDRERGPLPINLRLAGAFSGVISALTGTSGPVTLVPLLASRGERPDRAVALSQVIQVPVSAFASASNFALGGIDVPLAGLIALPLLAGVACGSLLAFRARIEWLRGAILALCLVAGILLLGEALR